MVKPRSQKKKQVEMDNADLKSRVNVYEYTHPKRGMLNKIKNYFSLKFKSFTRYCEYLGKKYPFLLTIYRIAIHPTTLRVISLVLAVAASIASGGTVPSLLILSFTFIGSLFAIVGKAKQIFSTEKVNQQKLLAKQVVNEKHRTHALVKLLSISDRKIFFQNTADSHLKNKPVHFMKIYTKSSIIRSFTQTMREIGIENILPVVAYASYGDIVGATVYFLSLVFTAKSETAARVKASEQKRQLRLQVNNLCRRHKIKKFTNMTELFEYYLLKKAETKALEVTMKECDNKFDLTKFKQHKAVILQNLRNTELQVYLRNIPETGKQGELKKPSYWRRLIHTLTPWKKIEIEDIHAEYRDQIIKTKQALIKPLKAGNLHEAAKEARPFITKLRKSSITDTQPSIQHINRIRQHAPLTQSTEKRKNGRMN